MITDTVGDVGSVLSFFAFNCLKILRRAAATYFRPGLSGCQRTLCWLHSCDHHGCSGHCALWRSSARGLREQPFLEDTQESSTAFEIVVFPRL